MRNQTNCSSPWGWALCFTPMQHYGRWQDLRRGIRTHARKHGIGHRVLRLNGSHWLSGGVKVPETVFDSPRSAWQVVGTYIRKVMLDTLTNDRLYVCMCVCILLYSNIFLIYPNTNGCFSFTSSPNSCLWLRRRLSFRLPGSRLGFCHLLHCLLYSSEAST